MSSSSTQTAYNLNISLGSMGVYNASITLYDNWGVDDPFVLGLAETLKGLAWPAGTTVTLQKIAASDTQYDADLSATPPVFT